MVGKRGYAEAIFCNGYNCPPSIEIPLYKQ